MAGLGGGLRPSSRMEMGRSTINGGLLGTRVTVVLTGMPQLSCGIGIFRNRGSS
jgi:hypothetical protein